MVSHVYNPRTVDLTVSEGTGVIKASDVAALEEAHSIVRAAEQKAAETTAAAETAYQSEKERGYREGRNDAERDAFTRLLSEQSFLDTRLRLLEQDLASLIKACVRKIVGELQDVVVAEAAAAGALRKLRHENQLQIHVPPSLAAEFTPIVSKLETLFPEIQTVELVEDSALAPPNLILESRTSRIECDLARNLEELDALIDATAAALSKTGVDGQKWREVAL